MHMPASAWGEEDQDLLELFRDPTLTIFGVLDIFKTWPAIGFDTERVCPDEKEMKGPTPSVSSTRTVAIQLGNHLVSLLYRPLQSEKFLPAAMDTLLKSAMPKYGTDLRDDEAQMKIDFGVEIAGCVDIHTEVMRLGFPRPALAFLLELAVSCAEERGAVLQARPGNV